MGARAPPRPRPARRHRGILPEDLPALPDPGRNRSRSAGATRTRRGPGRRTAAAAARSTCGCAAGSRATTSRSSCSIPSLKLDMVLREGLFQRLAKVRGRRTRRLLARLGAGARPQDRTPREVVVPLALLGRTDAFVVLARSSARRCGARDGAADPLRGDRRRRRRARGHRRRGGLIDRRLASRPRTVLFLARLLRPKGIHETLHGDGASWRRAGAADGKVPVRLLVAGDGPELEPARELRAARPRERPLRLATWAAPPSGSCCATRACSACRPSTARGCPTRSSRRWPSGCRCTTRRSAGVADFFRDGVHGAMVANAAPEAIAAALERLLDDGRAAADDRAHQPTTTRADASSPRWRARLEAIYRPSRTARCRPPSGAPRSCARALTQARERAFFGP